jgi:hypothetical protein
MTTKFSSLLEDYLNERDRQNSDHYEGRWFGDRVRGLEYMQELANEMDGLINGKEHNSD